MRIFCPQSLFTAAFVGATLVSGSARADEALRVTNAEVTVNCPLTIGGSFDAKTSALNGSVTPDGAGAVKGSFVVDLMKLETGISLRDRHLRNNYLEVQKGPDFAVAKMEDIKIQKLSGKTTFSAKLTVHGQQHDVTGAADVQQDGKGYRVDATFPIQISKFQIPEPTYLGVGVSDQINVHVVLTAAPPAPRATATTGPAGSK
jgi:polyisoprenoid-binding protein YceI